MLQILNRNYMQGKNEIKLEFPNCHFVMELESVGIERGRLLAISEDRSSYKELCNFVKEYKGSGVLLHAGFYEGECSFGIYSTIVERKV